MNLAKPIVGTDRSVIADPVDVDDCVHSTPFQAAHYGEVSLQGARLGSQRRGGGSQIRIGAPRERRRRGGKSSTIRNWFAKAEPPTVQSRNLKIFQWIGLSLIGHWESRDESMTYKNVMKIKSVFG